MNQGRIIVITGAPGTGKTTTASVVAKESDLEKSVHMHTDDFYHYLSKGAIHEQNIKYSQNFLTSEKCTQPNNKTIEFKRNTDTVYEIGNR